jgi:conjugative transfer pilus assembly protein TraH
MRKEILPANKTLFFFFILLLYGKGFGSHKVSVPERLFQMTGAETNVSEGEWLYKSQAAGYYTGGGGIVVRSPVKNTQFMGVHKPSIQAGCGGIDIYKGGFSFINGDQLVETLQAISSNAAGFAFMLGLESVSPSVNNTIRQLQSWSNMINGIGINSCEASARLVGSVWPANEMASQHICRTAGTSNPLFSDYLEGRHKCSTANGRQQVTNKVGQELPLEGDYNIAWEALKIQPFFKGPGNKELAEMYMSLVGTIVFKEENTPRTFPSKAEDSEFLNHLLEGGKIKKYACKDVKCLDIEEVEQDISLSDSWFAKIRQNLLTMQEKIIYDIELEPSEKGLLQTSRLPLFKIVNVLSAYHRGRPCTLELDNLANIISWDVLAQIINETIETVRRGCLQLRASSMYATKIDLYLNDLERVQKIVRRYEEHARKGIDLEMRLIQKMQLLEKQIKSEIMVN